MENIQCISFISKELDKIRPEKIEKLPESERVNFIISLFQQANAAVALLCNHQKTVSTNFDKMVDRINERIKKLRAKKRKYNERVIKTKNKDVKKSRTEKNRKIGS